MSAASNLTHCPATLCETDPWMCESSLDPAELAKLATIVVLPILIAIVVPCLGRGSIFGADDDRSSDPPDRTRVDPPMFCCGLGLLPLDCGLSGLLTLIAIMVAAFSVVFFSLLTEKYPCNSALGKCRTISCVCGSVIQEGYVFMFCSLALTSFTLIQRISRFAHHSRPQHRLFKAVMLLGSLLLVLPATMPERYDANGRMSGSFGLAFGLHILGVAGSGTSLVFVPALWFANHWRTHREIVPLRALLARCVYVSSLLAFIACLYIYGGAVVDQVNEYCPYLDEDQCEPWPLLTSDDCAALLRCVGGNDSVGGVGGGGGGALCSSLIQPNFRCGWRQTSSLNPWTRMLAPKPVVARASCVRLQCPLFLYARGVALEYAALLLTLTYVSSFGLHDVQRLLDRPPSKVVGPAEEERAPSLGGPGRYIGPSDAEQDGSGWCHSATPLPRVDSTCGQAPGGWRGRLDTPVSDVPTGASARLLEPRV